MQTVATQATAEHSPMANKQNLRAQLKAIRDALPPDVRDRKSEAACTRALADLGEARRIAVYHSIRSELCPLALVSALRDNGASIVYPRVLTSSRVLEFCEVTSASDLAPGALGILEPLPHLESLPLSSIDAFLIPALGFDPHGQRLGWGQGHYDHTLAQCPNALRVGICFQEQIVASLPCEPTDAPMDIVITDTKRHQGVPRPGRGDSRE